MEENINLKSELVKLMKLENVTIKDVANELGVPYAKVYFYLIKNSKGRSKQFSVVFRKATEMVLRKKEEREAMCKSLAEGIIQRLK